MNIILPNAVEAQKLAELHQGEVFAGAGAVGNFMVAGDLPLNLIEGLGGADQVALAGKSSLSTQATDFVAPVMAGLVTMKEDEQYLINDAKYQAMLDFIGKKDFSAQAALINMAAAILGGGGAILLCSLKTVPNNQTNEVLGSYQAEVDEQAKKQETKELLDKICQEAYGKNADECTDEEIIAAVDKYINEHVNYEGERSNEVGDLDLLVKQLLGGGEVGGDCEEYAMLKAALLEAAGIDAELGFTVNDQGVVDHVVVLAEGQILNNTGAEAVTQEDIVLKTTHDANGQAVVVDNRGNINNKYFVVNTQSGAETTAPAQPTHTATGIDAAGAISDIDEQQDKDTLGFADTDFKHQNSDGYWEADEEKLKEWTLRLLASCNVMSCLMIAMESQFNARKIADEIFSGVQAEAGAKSNWKAAFSRKTQSIQKIVNTASTKLLEKINKDNNAILEERLAKIAEEQGSCWGKTKNVLTLGYTGRKAAIESANHVKQGLKAAQANLKALQAVNKAIIEFLMGTDGDGVMQGLGMIRALKAFDKKLEEMNADVDKNLEKVEEQLDDLEDSGWWGGFKCIFEGIGKIFEGIFTGDGDLIAEGFGDFIEGIKNVVGAILTFVFDLVGYLFDAVAWLVDKIAGDLVDAIRDAIKTVITDIFKAIGWEEAGEFIADVNDWLVNGITQYITKYTVKVLETIGAAFKCMGTLIDYGFNQLDLNDGFAGGDWTNDGNVNGDLMDNLGKTWGNIWDTETEKDNIPDPKKSGLMYESFDMINLIQEYRGNLVAGQNAYRAYMSLKFFGTDLRNTVREKMTGLSGFSGNAELLMLSAEGMMGTAVRFFDATASQIMQRVSLSNTLVESGRALYQMNRATLFNVVAIVAAVVALVFAVIGCIPGLQAAWGISAAACKVAVAVAAISASACGAIGAKIAADIDTIEISEEELRYQGAISMGLGGVVLKGLKNIEEEEEANLQAAGKAQGMYIRNQDGSYTFNSKAFAALEMKQNILNNAIRAIFSLLKNGRDLRRIAEAEFTGVAFSDSGASLLQNMVENILLQKQVMLSAIKFKINERVNALNAKRRYEIAGNKAAGSGMASAIGAILGAIIGAFLPGGSMITLCMGLGAGLGAASYALYDAYYGEGNFHDAKLEDTNRDLEKQMKKRGEKSVEGKLDDAETECYEELLDNEAMVISTGDGKYGVNFSLVTSIYGRMGAIYQAKEMVARMKSFRSELRSMVKQQMTGIAGATTGDLSLAVIQASFSTAMRVAGSIVQFQQSRVAIMNKAVDAERQATMAWAMFAINAVLSVLGGLGASLGGPTLSAISRLAPSFISLLNGIANMINSSLRSRDDLGELESYNVKTTVDKTGKKVDSNRTIDEKLDQAEYELMCEMSTAMLSDLDGLNVSVSPEATAKSGRLSVLYNVRKALATIRSLMAEARRAAGATTLTSDYGKSIYEQQEQVAQAMLDSLKSVLDTIAERKSEINRAEMGLITASIDVVLSAVSVVLSGIAEGLGVEAKELGGNATQAGRDMAKTVKILSWVAKGCDLLNFAARVTVDSVYLSKNQKAVDELNKKANAHNAKTASAKSRKEAGKSDYFNSMNEMDADMAQTDIKMAYISTSRSASASLAAGYEKMFSNIKATVEQTIGVLKEKLAQDKAEGRDKPQAILGGGADDATPAVGLPTGTTTVTATTTSPAVSAAATAAVTSAAAAEIPQEQTATPQAEDSPNAGRPAETDTDTVRPTVQDGDVSVSIPSDTVDPAPVQVQAASVEAASAAAATVAGKTEVAQAYAVIATASPTSPEFIEAQQVILTAAREKVAILQANPQANQVVVAAANPAPALVQATSAAVASATTGTVVANPTATLTNQVVVSTTVVGKSAAVQVTATPAAIKAATVATIQASAKPTQGAVTTQVETGRTVAVAAEPVEVAQSGNGKVRVPNVPEPTAQVTAGKAGAVAGQATVAQVKSAPVVATSTVVVNNAVAQVATTANPTQGTVAAEPVEVAQSGNGRVRIPNAPEPTVSVASGQASSAVGEATDAIAPAITVATTVKGAATEAQTTLQVGTVAITDDAPAVISTASREVKTVTAQGAVEVAPAVVSSADTTKVTAPRAGGEKIPGMPEITDPSRVANQSLPGPVRMQDGSPVMLASLDPSMMPNPTSMSTDISYDFGPIGSPLQGIELAEQTTISAASQQVGDGVPVETESASNIGKVQITGPAATVAATGQVAVEAGQAVSGEITEAAGQPRAAIAEEIPNAPQPTRLDSGAMTARPVLSGQDVVPSTVVMQREEMDAVAPRGAVGEKQEQSVPAIGVQVTGPAATMAAAGQVAAVAGQVNVSGETVVAAETGQPRAARREAPTQSGGAAATELNQSLGLILLRIAAKGLGTDTGLTEGELQLAKTKIQMDRKYTKVVDNTNDLIEMKKQGKENTKEFRELYAQTEKALSEYKALQSIYIVQLKAVAQDMGSALPVSQGKPGVEALSQQQISRAVSDEVGKAQKELEVLTQKFEQINVPPVGQASVERTTAPVIHEVEQEKSIQGQAATTVARGEQATVTVQAGSAAAVAGMPQVSKAPNTTFAAVEQQIHSTKGLVEYADAKMAEVAAKAGELQVAVDESEAQVAGAQQEVDDLEQKVTKGQIANVDLTGPEAKTLLDEIPALRDIPSIAEADGAEQPKDLKELLGSLKAMLVDKKGQLDQANAQLKTLQGELAAYEASSQAALDSLDGQVATIKQAKTQELAQLQAQMADPAVSSEEKVVIRERIEGVKRELSAKEFEIFDHAKRQLDSKGQELKAQIAAVKQQIAALKPEIFAIQKAISQIKQKLGPTAEADEPESESRTFAPTEGRAKPAGQKEIRPEPTIIARGPARQVSQPQPVAGQVRPEVSPEVDRVTVTARGAGEPKPAEAKPQSQLPKAQQAQLDKFLTAKGIREPQVAIRESKGPKGLTVEVEVVIIAKQDGQTVLMTNTDRGPIGVVGNLPRNGKTLTTPTTNVTLNVQGQIKELPLDQQYKLDFLAQQLGLTGDVTVTTLATVEGSVHKAKVEVSGRTAAGEPVVIVLEGKSGRDVNTALSAAVAEAFVEREQKPATEKKRERVAPVTAHQTAAPEGRAAPYQAVEARPAPSTRAQLDRADQIMQASAQKMEGVLKEVEEVAAISRKELGELRQMAAKADPATRTQIEAKIKELETALAAKQVESKSLKKELQTLKEQIALAKQRQPAKMADLEREISGLKARMLALVTELGETAPNNPAKIASLQRQIAEVDGKIKMTYSAEEQLGTEARQLEEQAVTVQGRVDKVKREVTALHQEMKVVRSELARVEESGRQFAVATAAQTVVERADRDGRKKRSPFDFIFGVNGKGGEPAPQAEAATRRVDIKPSQEFHAMAEEADKAEAYIRSQG